MSVLAAVLLVGCRTQRQDSWILRPGTYRVTGRHFYDTIPPDGHPTFDVKICGQTDLSYQTLQGLTWHVETGNPADYLRVEVYPTNSFDATLTLYVDLDGTNLHVSVKHGTNYWQVETEKIELPNKVPRRVP